MKKQLILFLLTVALQVSAEVPSGYYNSLEGKKTAILKTALHDIICQDTTHYLGYGSGKGKTWEGFYSTDRDLSNNAVIDMYSANVRFFAEPNPNFTAFGNIINIEHSLPKSWWGCDITHPDCPAKDLNQLYPADGSTNSSKNDDPLGVVTGTPTKNNGVSKIGPGTSDNYTGAVFEPADQYKGDFARSYFYMATAYEHYASRWDTSKPENMLNNNTYPVFKPGALALLLKWHRQDPVSEKERARTDVVYSIQNNRNPFIDHPELAEYIWGSRMSETYSLTVTSVSAPKPAFFVSSVSVDNELRVQSDYRDISYSVYNLSGQLILNGELTGAKSISIDKLDNGLHLIQLSSGNVRLIQKFIVSR